MQHALFTIGLGFLAVLPTGVAGRGSVAQPALAPLDPVSKFEIQGAFAGKKPDRTAKDISGIACMKL